MFGYEFLYEFLPVKLLVYKWIWVCVILCFQELLGVVSASYTARAGVKRKQWISLYILSWKWWQCSEYIPTTKSDRIVVGWVKIAIDQWTVERHLVLVMERRTACCSKEDLKPLGYYNNDVVLLIQTCTVHLLIYFRSSLDWLLSEKLGCKSVPRSPFDIEKGVLCIFQRLQRSPGTWFWDSYKACLLHQRDLPAMLSTNSDDCCCIARLKSSFGRSLKDKKAVVRTWHSEFWLVYESSCTSGNHTSDQMGFDMPQMTVTLSGVEKSYSNEILSADFVLCKVWGKQLRGDGFVGSDCFQKFCQRPAHCRESNSHKCRSDACESRGTPSSSG